MNCLKCGNTTTRRRAGVFFCQRHGMQPGDTNMDRAGFPQRNIQMQGPPPGPAYTVDTIRTPKLRGASVDKT